ncbi:MAG TPA: tetratricopeptide repeat protein [Bryobacteraceae bacterium]|nr:tetratricopeptide repeat protein [Bryobacteraceae bacterium]
MRSICRAAAAAVLAGGLTAPAAEQWLKLKSTHFELYTTASERKGREAILYFEQVRDFFSKVLKGSKSTAAPVRIIAFRSEKEYKPFRPSEFAAAFYLPGYDRDYIVMESITSENYPVAVHEFTHMLVKHSGMEAPVWFNEGLADLYSTMKPVGKKVQIGDLIPGRVMELRERKWLPLDVLFGVDHNSPYYNERDRAGVFYSESWALVHMLTLAPGYRPQFSKFVTTLASGVPAGKALEQVYTKTPAEVQKDLRQYLNGSSFYAVTFNVKLEKSDEEPDIDAAPAIETGMVLADLLALSGKDKEASEKYESLIKAFPNNWEPEAGSGELAWREKDIEGARRHFARAAELGSTNPRLYFDYAMVLKQSGQDDRGLAPVLKKAVELDPDYQEAHHYLAFCLLQTQDYQGAVEHFTKVRTVKAADAFSYYSGLAYANYRLEKRDAAKKAADAARKYARSPEQIAQAEQMLRAIDQPAPQMVQRAMAQEQRPAAEPSVRQEPTGREEPEDEKPKRLVRRPEAESPPAVTASPMPVRRALFKVEGKLEQIDCLGKVARLRVIAGSKPVLLAITDPEAVSVKGTASGTLELTCGPQKNKLVAIEYESRPDARLGTAGVVRSIEFR